jgi:hypothetical protein
MGVSVVWDRVERLAVAFRKRGKTRGGHRARRPTDGALAGSTAFVPGLESRPVEFFRVVRSDPNSVLVSGVSHHTVSTDTS